jgi:hypothetical protein
VTLNIQDIIDASVSHAQRTGYFDSVNSHEPKAAPGNGVTCAIWVNAIDPIRAGGLASTSLRLELNVRIYTSMLQEPQDTIDVNAVLALDSLMGSYSNDFQLDGLAALRMVDLLGAYGAGLSARAGYLNADGKLNRVFTIVLPLIMNDIWEQVA